MQKKQKIQFAVLVILIVGLIGAYFGIRAYNQKQQEKKEQEQAASEITLTSFRAEDVTQISYDYNGEIYEFEKEAGKWKYRGDDNLSLDQDAFESFLENVGSLKAEAKVNVNDADDTDDANADDYGFGAPTRTVTITTENGTSSLIFGMKNEMLSQYYIKTSESSEIYLTETSVYTGFDKTAEDFKAEDTQTDADAENENADAEDETAEKSE